VNCGWTCADTTLAQRWSTPESGRPAAWRPDGASLKSAWAVLGRFKLTASRGQWPITLSVTANDPVLACLASQYAGWSLSSGTGKTRFHALGSGPARALAVKEALFEELGYRDQASSTYLVLEVDREPPAEVVEKVVRDCQVGPEQLNDRL